MLIVSGGGVNTQIYDDNDGWTVIPYTFQYRRNWIRLVTFQNRVLFLGTAPLNKTCAFVQRLLEALKINLKIKVM